MQFVAGMTPREYAQFIVDNTPDPTEGMILDALKDAGADEDEIKDALDYLQNMLTDTEIDIPDDVDAEIAENEDKLDAVEEEIDSGTAPIDTLPVDVPADLVETADSIPDEEGPVYDENPMDVDPAEEKDTVELSPDELFETMSDYLKQDPDASEEDLKRYLLSLGVPGDKIERLMEYGLDMTRASKFNAALTKEAADISWMTAAQFVMQHNPNISSEDLKDALRNAGASEFEIEEVLQQLPAQEEPIPDQTLPPDPMQNAMDPNAANMQAPPPMRQSNTEDRMANGERTSPSIGNVVQTPKGLARVAGIMPTLGGIIYEVELENNKVAFYGEEAIEEPKEEKTASADIHQKIASHMEEEWYTDVVNLPRAHKAAYVERLDKTVALLGEVKNAVKTASGDQYQELLKADVQLTHEYQYLKDRIANSFTVEDAEYLGSQPKYRVTASRGASEFGGRSLTLDAAAAAAEEEAANINWKHEVTAGAELFVEEISPILIGSSGDVRRMASRYITSKTAALEEDEARKIHNAFVENAEKARRRVVKELRQSTPKEASTDLPDGAADEGVFI